MAQAYTPGLRAAQRTLHRALRYLPLPGEVLVQSGQQVSATQVVARTLLPGAIAPINVAQALAVPAGELPRCLQKRVGDPVSERELLARSTGLFGWFPKDCLAPAAGTIESISQVTGQVLIRGAPQAVELRAYLAGAVVEVAPGEGVAIEAEVTLVQGIFGIGGEAYGPIRPVCSSPEQVLTPELIAEELRGAIVLGGGRVTAAALARAVDVGVSAIVTGGIDDQDLRDFLGYDLGVATTGAEKVGLTLIITEGFGEIGLARSTWELLSSRAGDAAAVNGATQIRAGVVRPEIVIPWQSAAAVSASAPRNGDALAGGVLQPGAAVRIIRDPYFGMVGAVSGMPPEPQVLGSGSKARVVEVHLDTGDRVIVPRANVELVSR